jgi:TolB-like protein
MTETSSKLQPEPHNSEQLLDALARVLASTTFAEVFRLKKFLEYVVSETIAGRGDRLKGFVIACDVFGKEDPSDAQTTTVVRVEAGRLRRRLKDYYDSEGRNDPVRITIPKGAYSASFSNAPRESTTHGPPRAPGAGRQLIQQPGIWVLLVFLLALIVFSVWKFRPDSAAEPDILHNIRPTIAVLPFENMTGEDPDNSFAIGLTEDIVIDLGSLSALDVISISSVLPYRGHAVTPREIGIQLGAGYVLQGSVRGMPPNLRVTARLHETGSGRQLWAERFDRQVGDELALQKELARKVVTSLSISLQDDDVNAFGRRYTQNREAWYLYKQAMNLANPPSDPARLKLAQQAFNQVIGMDPDFAGGYAGGAYTRAFMVFFGHSGTPLADREAAMVLAARARDIDPSFGLTFSALAFIYLSQRKFDLALEMSEKANKIQPNAPYITVYHGFIAAANSDLDGGIEYAKHALRLDPLSARTPYLNILGLLHFLAGNYPEALDALMRNQERGGPLGPGSMQFLAVTYSKMGQMARAELTLKLADTMTPEDYNWETWFLSAFKDPALPHKVLDEIEIIRERVSAPH